MRFNPIKQFSTILEHEYLEPTFSWSIRVVLALNVPLIVFPLLFGFSYHIVWSAFAAYMLTLIDYRGTHYRKMLIQLVETLLILFAAIIGMNVGNSVTLSIIGMFVIGVFAALIRNWSDYGSTIGVGVGFFYLFGISNPTSFLDSLMYGQYIVFGALWAILIIFISFPFSASNPMRRSVATIWKANTNFLDSIISELLSNTTDEPNQLELTAKETEIRKSIDKSIELFNRRKENSKLKADHYDQMIEIRKKSAFFGASAKLLLDEFTALRNHDVLVKNQSIVYKTLSALSQACARTSIVVFTNRGEDFTMAAVRSKRFLIASNILKKTVAKQAIAPEYQLIMQQLFSSLEQCYTYLQDTLDLIDAKNKFKKSNYFENYKLSFNHFIAGLQPRVMWQIIREVFNIDSQQFQYALRVGVGLAFSVFLFKFLKIDHGHWIALTLLIVIQPYYGATRKKGIERIVGTVAGIVVGGVILLLPIGHQGFVISLIFISFFVAYFLRNNYKVGVFFVTIMMVVVMQLSKTGSWELIGWRVLSTVIGATLAIVISAAFWPVWEKQRFPNLMEKALSMNRFYFHQVIEGYVGTLPAGQTWHKSRRQTEAANNNLFACVQRMYEEPEAHKREIDAHFAKVGTSVRITREITSLAFSLEKTPKNEALVIELRAIAEALHPIYDKLLERADNFHFETVMSLIENSNTLQQKEMQLLRLDIEKMIFELAALKVFRK